MKKSHRKHRSKFGIFQKARNWIEEFWDKYWSIIVALIAGIIVGKFILPKFFR
jgi:hypothetical protein